MRGSVLAGVALLVGCGPSKGPEGQCKDQLVAGDLVITEVFADYRAAVGGSGSDEGKEWIEIYNATDRPIELEGLRIDHGRPEATPDDIESHFVGTVTLAPGQYFTLGNAAPDLLPPYVDYGYGPDLGGLFNSDGGRIALACGETEIDAATYEAVSQGASRQLTAATFPDYTLNDDPANWCEAADAEFEAENFGTPGFENDCTPVVIGFCNDGGTQREAVTPMPGDLVITEVMPSPDAVADGDGEWFEALATADVDLNGVAPDRAGDTANPRPIESPDCIRVTAGSHVVFAKNADAGANGGLPPVSATFTFSLVGGSESSPGDVQLLAGTTVIDAIAWTGSRNGSSLALDPDLVDPVANDSESNFCDGATAYGLGDLGTPGAANEQCVLLPPAGMCDDNGTIRPIVKPAVGELVISEFLANPAGTGTDAAQEWFEVTNTGAAAFDLNELGIKGNGATINLIQSAACVSVAPGGFALLARNPDPMQNGGLPAVDATFSIALANSNGSITVLDGVNVIDATTWTTPSPPDGVSRQLDPGTLTSTANDDQGSFCDSTPAQEYGTFANFGTPKAANTCL